MQNMIFGNSMWQLIIQSDVMTKFVLLLLLFLSILCWTIFFYKIVLLNIKIRQMRRALNYLKKIKSFEDIILMSERFAFTLPGYFLSRNLDFLKKLIQDQKDFKKNKLDEKQFDVFQLNMQQVIDNIVYNEESYLAVLSTSSAISPLLGLFGTVWGLVHSFIRISEKRAADIAVVAPGIAEALITTLAGLMVAIPALVMFHVLTLKIRKLEHQLYIITDKFNYVVQKLLLS